MLRHALRRHSAVIVSFAMIIAVIATHAGAEPTADQIAALDQNLAAFETLISQTASAASDKFAAVSNGTMTTTCTINPACGPQAIDVTGYVPNFAQPIPVPFDYVQTKIFSGASQDEARLCAAASLKPQWSSTLAAAQGNVLYQYYAGSRNNFAVYPPTPWNCSNPYVPTQRPYYVSGATGAKDVVILIDVSSDSEVDSTTATYRVAKSVEAAVALLQTLSFRDYVAVVPYSDFPVTAITPSLVQATVETVKLLVSLVRSNVSMIPGSNANPAGAMRAAVSMLSAATAASASSGCTQTIVMISSGFDDYQGQNAADTVSGTSIIAFTVYVSGSTAMAAAQIPVVLRRIACAGNGLAVWGAGDQANTTAAVLKFNSYFASLVTITAPRWSEWYVDAFGQGSITSTSMPVYTYSADGTSMLEGLVVLDVPLQNVTLGGQITSGDLNTYLQNHGSCIPIDVSGNAALISSLQSPSQCVGTEVPASETPKVRKLMPLLVILSIIAAGATIGIPIAVACTNDGDFNPIPLSLLTAVLWVVVLAIFWSITFNDLVNKATYTPVNFVVTREVANPTPCCAIVSCSCSSFSGPSCGTKLAQMSPGTCDNGYYCCSRTCYSCNCRSSGSGKRRRTRCSTCCTCSSWVSHRQCTVGCGTCYNPTITVTYSYEGAVLTSHISTSCGMDNTGCRDEFLNKYTVGNSYSGFVNPSNPYDIVTDVKVNLAAGIATLLFFLATLGVAIANLYFTIRDVRNFTQKKQFSDFDSLQHPPMVTSEPPPPAFAPPQDPLPVWSGGNAYGYTNAQQTSPPAGYVGFQPAPGYGAQQGAAGPAYGGYGAQPGYDAYGTSHPVAGL